jgi:hypothetical protein
MTASDPAGSEPSEGSGPRSSVTPCGRPITHTDCPGLIWSFEATLATLPFCQRPEVA